MQYVAYFEYLQPVRFDFQRILVRIPHLSYAATYLGWVIPPDFFRFSLPFQVGFDEFVKIYDRVTYYIRRNLIR